MLVAISIPIFTAQLEKSRDAVTLSNIRAAYAEAQTAYLTGGDSIDSNVSASLSNDAGTVTVKSVRAMGHTSNGLTSTASNLPFYSAASAALSTMDSGNGSYYDVTFSYSANGTITGVTASVSQQVKP